MDKKYYKNRVMLMSIEKGPLKQYTKPEILKVDRPTTDSTGIMHVFRDGRSEPLFPKQLRRIEDKRVFYTN